MNTATYQLYYWPMIQGRGEFVRLSLEEAAAPYVDVARLPESQGGGVPALMKMMRDGAVGLAPFAPPFLRAGDLLIAQTANILAYLGARLGQVPDDEPSRMRAMQLQLTVADLLVEVHDAHHPIGMSLYYDDQKIEARRRSTSFVAERIPKYLGYFERALEQGGGEHFLGGFSYVDLSMFQVMVGLDYAFPRAMKRAAGGIASLLRLRDRVANRPRIAAYLPSTRRIPFNEHGIFRHYPELDAHP